MNKIVVLSGSPRKKGNTMKLVNEIQEEMNHNNDFEFEMIYIYDYEIKACIGCKLCNIKDGLACPFKDDLLTVLNKLEKADGIIFTSPTYSRAVTGPLKNFIDRTNYVLHRPSLVNIPTIILTTTDLGMAKKVSNYLEVIASSMGSRLIGSLAIKMGMYHNEEDYKTKTKKQISELSKRFETAVLSDHMVTPTFKNLMRFNIWKTRAIVTKEKYPNDYKYWEENDWINKDFFYDVSVSFHKKLLMKILVKRMSKLIKRAFLY